MLIIIRSEFTEIIIQRITPWTNGLTPTVFNTSLESPAPIRKSVTVKPDFAIVTMCSEIPVTNGKYVRTTEAARNKKIK